MPKILLDVLHLQQNAESDCVPTCVQMVLAYLGKPQMRQGIAEVLRTRPFDTPVENILKLESLGFKVQLAELSLTDIVQYLQNNRPVIAFVNTLDLPYWNEDTDHAVVVVGADDTMVYLNDPFFKDAPQPVTHTAFELSLLRFDQRCAVIQP
jgi:ABC-type bacteriocin/lantibiotic exporter with double-glycine peptidase domain